MGQLVVFDIDGTLTDTNGVDDECYCNAVAAALGVSPSDIDWSGAMHVTDAEIFNWLCVTNSRALPTQESVTRARDDFVSGLRRELTTHPNRFGEIHGARKAIDSLDAAGWRFAIATGGWGASARMKLQAASMIDDGVIACADDAVSRAEIIQVAIARAERAYASRFERIVAVGDGQWDVTAAVLLGLPFIGVGSGERAELLRSAGASVVLADYTDLDAFHRALANARVPGTDHAPSRSAFSGARDD